MSASEHPVASCVIAIYPDHAAAEDAIRRLHGEGFDLRDLSILGRNVEVSEQPTGLPVTPIDYATTGAETGAWFGGIFGLLVGAAFVILPGLGPVLVAGPLAAALLGGVEGALAGAALGALTGALVGWGVPKDLALTFETHVKAGKFLVVARGTAENVDRARSLLAPDNPEHLEVYNPSAPH